MSDPGHREELADLLEADFCFSLGDHGANALTTCDTPAFPDDLVRYSQALKQLGRDEVAAYAGGVRDGFRLHKRASQRVDRADVRLRGSCPHRDANRGAREGSIAFGYDKTF